MWFPPYNMEVNESTRWLNLNQQSMVGRSEPMYSYPIFGKVGLHLVLHYLVDYPQVLKNQLYLYYK